MGKGSSSAPAAPTPAGSTNFLNGILTSSTSFDPHSNSYTNQSYMNPTEQSIYNQAEQGLNSTFQNAGASGAFNPSADQLQTYAKNYAQPQIDALNNSYALNRGQAVGAANSRGTLNSVGFNDFLANQLDRNQAQDLSNIQANASNASYQLPSIMEQPYLNGLNFYSGGQTGQANQAQQSLNNTFNSANSANSFNLANYPNQLQSYQQNRGFLGRLFG